MTINAPPARGQTFGAVPKPGDRVGGAPMQEDRMSDTPRTDQQAHFLAMQGWMVEVEFARKLERELNEAHEYGYSQNVVDALTKDRDEARAELARAMRVVEAAKEYAKHFGGPLYLTNAVEEWEAGR